MDDIDWVRIVAGAITALTWFYIGRWTQRRDDRKALRRRQERRFAEAMAAQTLRNRNRGGNP